MGLRRSQQQVCIPMLCTGSTEPAYCADIDACMALPALLMPSSAAGHLLALAVECIGTQQGTGLPCPGLEACCSLLSCAGVVGPLCPR
jgi:hypothetical protein